MASASELPSIFKINFFLFYLKYCHCFIYEIVVGKPFKNILIWLGWLRRPIAPLRLWTIFLWYKFLIEIKGKMKNKTKTTEFAINKWKCLVLYLYCNITIIMSIRNVFAHSVLGIGTQIHTKNKWNTHNNNCSELWWSVLNNEHERLCLFPFDTNTEPYPPHQRRSRPNAFTQQQLRRVKKETNPNRTSVEQRFQSFFMFFPSLFVVGEVCVCVQILLRLSVIKSNVIPLISLIE